MRNEEIIKIRDLGNCFYISIFIQIIFPFFISYDSFRTNVPSVIPVLFLFAPIITLIFMILFMTGLYKKKRIDKFLVIISNIIYVVLKNCLYKIYSNHINNKNVFFIDIISLIILIGIIIIFDHKHIISKILLLLRRISVKYTIINKIISKTNICIKHISIVYFTSSFILQIFISTRLYLHSAVRYIEFGLILSFIIYGPIATFILSLTFISGLSKNIINKKRYIILSNILFLLLYNFFVMITEYSYIYLMMFLSYIITISIINTLDKKKRIK